MKISLFTLAFSSATGNFNSTDAPLTKAPRRFADFKRMFYAFFSHEDLTKIYGYGCYCLNLGDRPLSGMMSGVVPVDEVDHMCFKWTKCNRCASMDHGESCSAETTKYRFRINAQTEDIICTDPEGSCGRNLCECDRHATYQLRDMLEGVSAKSEFLAHNGFNADVQCKRRVNTRSQAEPNLQCCGQYPHRFPFNSNQKQCCENKIMSINSCWWIRLFRNLQIHLLQHSIDKSIFHDQSDL